MKLRSLTYIIPVVLFALCACGTDKTEQVNNEPAKEPPVFSSPAYLLKSDVELFIGNESVPDFVFNEAFIAQNKISEIIAGERFLPAQNPTDTTYFAPLYVWTFDSSGMNLQKHVFEQSKVPVHSDHYVLEEKRSSTIGAYKVNINTDAVSLIKKNGQQLIREIRVEAANADTTHYYYRQNLLDSISVSFLNGQTFYIKFFRFSNGVISRRVLKHADKNELSKDWTYAYDDHGRLTTITEASGGNGQYTFNWDEQGRLVHTAYTIPGKTVFDKKIIYNDKNLISGIEMLQPTGKSFFDFVYKTR